MATVPDQTYDYAHASHVLEHIANPYLALKNWICITRIFGHLILLVPHRDLYEKKRELPSRWNPDHKFFLLPDEEDLPYTLSLKKLIQDSVGDQVAIVYLKVCDEGWQDLGNDAHSCGEYSIEAVLKRIR